MPKIVAFIRCFYGYPQALAFLPHLCYNELRWAMEAHTMFSH